MSHEETEDLMLLRSHAFNDSSIRVEVKGIRVVKEHQDHDRNESAEGSEQDFLEERADGLSSRPGRYSK